MKKILYILLLIMPLSALAQSVIDNENVKWDQANKHYADGEYTPAILLYEELLGGGSHSQALYYNLGNAYFKNNNLGRAVLNYNRAMLLDPSDEDIQYNLALATARTIDKIEPAPEFFIKTWFKSIGSLLSSDAWAILSLITFAISLMSIVIWLISTKLGVRKLGFYSAICAVMVCATSVIYSQTAYSQQVSSSDAIILNSAAPVKSAPSASSKDLFLLHEGTKVAVLNTVADWSEVLLEDGNKGWIQTAALEQIVLR